MRIPRSRVAVLAASAMVVALAMTGCAGGGAPADQPNAEAEGPIEHVTISMPAPNLSFDITASVSATDRVVDQLINGALVTLEFDGSVSPGLAETYEFNDDFTTFTANLIEGATFSDGTPLTAHDVVATVERHKGIEGSTLGDMIERITKVEASDDSTVVFTFDAPYPSFEAEVAFLGIAPASALADAEAYYENPTVTSGQYTVTKPWAGSKLELAANENYWGAQPIASEVTLVVIEDANSAISQLQSGEIDFAGDLAPNFVTQIAGTEGIDVVTTPVYGFFDLRMWNKSGPFADVNMRKAVNAALDREAIVSSIWGEENEPLAGFWPPSMEGHDSSKSTARDLDAAEEYLAETDCADGCSVRMMYSDQDFPFSGQLALMVQSQLKEVGIDVQLEKLDASTLIDRLFAGDYDLAPGAMPSTGNVPDPLLKNALLGSGFLMSEFTGYDSAEMNDLIQQVSVNSGELRTEGVTEIEALFSKDQPYATIAPWVRGSATTLPQGVFSLVGASAKMGSIEE